MKFCKDCKHAMPSEAPDPQYKLCAKFPIEDKVNLVTGESTRDKYGFYFCSNMRAFDDKCGEAGRFFEPRLAVA